MKRVWSLAIMMAVVLATLAALLAGFTSAKPSTADSGYSVQGQGQGNEKRHDNGEFLALLTVRGAIFSDAEGDVVTVGVAQSEQCNAVKQKGQELGIDPACIVASPIESVVGTLQDYDRPLEGGLQIAFSANGRGYYCTLGFNAVRSDVPGFVVNSHCTSKEGAVDGTKHYQPTITAANLIGTEIADPAFLKGNGCPISWKCRYSDSAYVQRAVGVTATLGSIERTEGLGSLTIAGSFGVVGEAPTASVGETLNKVGRTTGWTQGNVTKSCVMVVTSPSTILRCQGFVDADVYFGDSGSPVFGNINGNDVQLHGILWGGTDKANGTFNTFIYSPIAGIESDLGVLTTH